VPPPPILSYVRHCCERYRAPADLHRQLKRRRPLPPHAPPTASIPVARQTTCSAQERGRRGGRTVVVTRERWKFFGERKRGVMAAAPRDRRRRGRAPGAASAAAAEDDGEEHHLNPFLSDEAPSSSRIQFRCVLTSRDLVCSCCCWCACG
jgi:hypothetical protein